MNSLKHPDSPIYKMLDIVLDERMWDTMYVQHEGPHYDVMKAIERSVSVSRVGIATRHHWFRRPVGSFTESPTYSQYADLSVGWKHVVPIWSVRRSFFETQVPTYFAIESPDALFPMIPLSKNFACVELILDEGDYDSSLDYPIAFFNEGDAVAAQAMMAR